MKHLTMRLEEYYPAGRFLRTSLVRDLAELATRFSDFTTGYETAYESKLEEVKVLEQSVVLTEAQKGVTKALYIAAEEMNTELNFLKFQMTRAGLDTAGVVKVKRDIKTHNIEGACLKLEGVHQYILDNSVVLEAKGMDAGFPAVLAASTVDLEAKNEMQNQVMNELGELHEANKGVYKSLYDYISTIAAAGKVMYKGTVKESEYTITHILGRMRSSGGVIPPVVPPVV